MINNTKPGWQQCKSENFWGEIAPCNHLVQIYESDEAFLDLLEEFVTGGIKADDAVIIIATQAHLAALEKRIKLNGFDPKILIEEDQYVPLDAEKCLAKFMVTGWPDEKLFAQFVTPLIKRAHARDRSVRAFGEMVALLWAQGFSGATVQLEHLWNEVCETEAFCLFCAYPKSGFTNDADKSIRAICDTHTKVIANWDKANTEIFYRDAV